MLTKHLEVSIKLPLLSSFFKKNSIRRFQVYTRYSYDRMLDTISTFITYERITNLPYLVQPIMHFLNYHTKFEFIDFLFFFLIKKNCQYLIIMKIIKFYLNKACFIPFFTPKSVYVLKMYFLKQRLDIFHCKAQFSKSVQIYMSVTGYIILTSVFCFQ